jgi:hypothetical protein
VASKGWDGVSWNVSGLGDAGPRLSEGEHCYDEGAQIECGKVTEQHADYVTCSMGVRICVNGAWGACQGSRFTQKPVTKGTGARLLGLGSSATCSAGFDPCDPYCNQVVDTPGGFSAGPNLSNTSDGVTPLPTGVGNCTSLSLTPSTSTLTVTSFSSLPAPVTFTLTAAPNGCAEIPFLTTWTVDKLDRASMSTSTATSDGGRLTLAVPIAGTMKVTAFAHGLDISTNVAVKVNVVDAPTTAAAATALGIPTGLASTAAFVTAFGPATAPLAGTAVSTASWLYPYAATYFPLGLPSPTIQYRYTSGFGKAVKVSLRYPINTSATTATFNYSLIVKEANVISQTAGVAANVIDPQVVIPQTAWQYFEQVARGDDADLIVQRLQGALEIESRRSIHFVSGQLKGTVYYNSYSSPQGNDTGAVLSIAPGATSPTLAVQPSSKCTVCHSLNLDGTTLIANGGTTNAFNQSRRYDLTTYVSAYTPATLTSYADSVAGDFTPGDYDIVGDRFTFGAPWLDGSVYLTHGGWALYGGDANWRAPNDYSKFYRPTANSTSSTAISVTNWSNISAVTPRFSPDGGKVAFGFWGGTGSTLRCSSNAASPCTTSSGNKVLAPVSGGTRLVVADFTSPSNPSSSTGWAVSNARDVTPSVAQKVAWPSFTSDGTAVLYQRQYRSSKSLIAWSPSDINTVAGALAEIWMSNIPADGSTAATPTRLSNLNGVSGLPPVHRALYPLVRFDMSQTLAGQSIYLNGTPADGPWDVRIKITTGGTRGTAKFQYSTDGGSTYSANVSTASGTTNYVLGTTGLTAVLGNSSAYTLNSVYAALTGRVDVIGTPTSSSYSTVRIAITTIGAPGTAKFKYSTDGSTPSSTAITIPSGGGTVALGATGLSATFADVTYDSTSYGYWATISGTYPSYHQSGASFTINQADNCAVSATATGVNDYQLNYLPTVAPTEAGGHNWVVFTSRRMYGNVATDDPWDAEPNQACSSGTPPTKKLWIAAVDKTWTPGTDPSHPAFYFPGQELAAGNSNGYWVNAQCSALGATCSSDDDCCGGTGSSPTKQCGVVSTATVPPTKQCQAYESCSAAGEGCATDDDCCTGLVCPDGGGDCVSLPSPVYEVQSFDREYVASCPSGTHVAWRFFEWQASIPSGTSINFAIQARKLATDTYRPTVALAMATATTTTPANTWERGSDTSDDLLVDAGIFSQTYLRVTMTFNPNPAGTAAPTLLNWRQIFDCLPSD